MIKHTVDTMVTHSLQCLPYNGVNKKCEDMTLIKKRSLFTNFCIPKAWDTVLRQLLYANCSPFTSIPRPLVCVTWRETSSRKVLAPLPLKQNCEPTRFSTQVCVKRPFFFDEVAIITKRMKIESPNEQPPRTCKVLLKKTSVRNMYIEYKCLNTQSSVKLLDVFKEIPQIKQHEEPVLQNDFMKSLKLNGAVNTKAPLPAEPKTSHPIKLVNHHQIPFSSDYGRCLLIKDRHFVSEDVILRKLERTEWYLKYPPLSRRGNTEINHDIRFDKRIRNYHKYRFPKRQMHYRNDQQSVKVSFLEYICRPVCVRLERMNLDAVIEAQRQKQLDLQVKISTPLLPETEQSTNCEELTQNAAMCNEINFLDIVGEHLISNSDVDVSSDLSVETIENPVLHCKCGEDIVLESLLECVKKPSCRKKTQNGIVRRSLRLSDFVNCSSN